MGQKRRLVTVSFSGAGHLLSYHLGVATVLKEKNAADLVKIQATAGSSSGAIAATLLAKASTQELQDYSQQFLKQRGHAFQLLQEMLLSPSSSAATPQQGNFEHPTAGDDTKLFISTTKAEDGSLHFFEFDQRETGHEKLLKAIQASCHIPKSFHPIDIFESSSKSSYNAPGEGIEIDGEFYVDGGIAAPLPTVPREDDDLSARTDIYVTPLSIVGPEAVASEKSTGTSSTIYISPEDSTIKLLPFVQSLSTRSHNLNIRPTLFNLRAAIAAAGILSTQALAGWFELGRKDAERTLDLFL